MATTRRVSIKTPDQLDLRAIQQAIDNIRERITGAEALADNLTLTVGAKGASGAGDITDLRKQIQALRVQLDKFTILVRALEAADDLQTQLSGISAELGEMRKMFDSMQPPADTMPAIVAELAKRVDGLEQGVLV